MLDAIVHVRTSMYMYVRNVLLLVIIVICYLQDTFQNGYLTWSLLKLLQE